MIFSLFWEGAFIRRGRLFEGAFILKSEILGGVHSRGRLFEAGRLFEEIRYLSALFLWRLAMLKSSGTPTSTIVHVVRFLSHMTMSGLLCSILFGVCKGLSHQISLVGVLMTGSGRSILAAGLL